MSQKSKNREKEENAGLKNQLDKYLHDFDKAFADIESMKDPAEKILKLQELNGRVYRAKSFVNSVVPSIVKERAKRTAKTYLKRTGLALSAMTIVGMIPIVDASWTSKSSVAAKSSELKAAVDVDGFNQTMTGHQQRIVEMLEMTVKTCDLKETSQSPYFSDALHNCAPLKKKFDAAAIARAALGDKEPQASAPQAAPTKNFTLKK